MHCFPHHTSFSHILTEWISHGPDYQGETMNHKETVYLCPQQDFTPGEKAKINIWSIKCAHYNFNLPEEKKSRVTWLKHLCRTEIDIFSEFGGRSPWKGMMLHEEKEAPPMKSQARRIVQTQGTTNGKPLKQTMVRHVPKATRRWSALEPLRVEGNLSERWVVQGGASRETRFHSRCKGKSLSRNYIVSLKYWFRLFFRYWKASV